jgi:hypothetical protein
MALTALPRSIHCAFVTTDASPLEREAQVTAALSAKSDEALVAMVRDPDNLQETYPGELQRRLLESNRELTAALHAFKASSDTASDRLLRLTWVLMGSRRCWFCSRSFSSFSPSCSCRSQ